MALLRAVRDCGTLRAVSLVNLGLGDHFCRSLARVLPRLAALRLLDVSLNLLSGRGLEALTEVPDHHAHADRSPEPSPQPRPPT